MAEKVLLWSPAVENEECFLRVCIVLNLMNSFLDFTFPSFLKSLAVGFRRLQEMPWFMELNQGSLVHWGSPACVWGAKDRRAAEGRGSEMMGWAILHGKRAVHRGFFTLLKKKKSENDFFLHSQNRWDVKWVLSEWMEISYNAHSGRLGFYLSSENKNIFSP